MTLDSPSALHHPNFDAGRHKWWIANKIHTFTHGQTQFAFKWNENYRWARNIILIFPTLLVPFGLGSDVYSFSSFWILKIRRIYVASNMHLFYWISIYITFSVQRLLCLYISWMWILGGEKQFGQFSISQHSHRQRLK